MENSPYHIPVLLHVATDALITKENGLYIDLTFGGGGHSKAILNKIKDGQLIAFDQDEDAKLDFGQGVQVVLDHMSYPYILGSKIDYVENLMGSKFTVENPNTNGIFAMINSLQFVIYLT